MSPTPKISPQIPPLQASSSETSSTKSSTSSYIPTSSPGLQKAESSHFFSAYEGETVAIHETNKIFRSVKVDPGLGDFSMTPIKYSFAGTDSAANVEEYNKKVATWVAELQVDLRTNDIPRGLFQYFVRAAQVIAMKIEERKSILRTYPRELLAEGPGSELEQEVEDGQRILALLQTMEIPGAHDVYDYMAANFDWAPKSGFSAREVLDLYEEFAQIFEQPVDDEGALDVEASVLGKREHDGEPQEGTVVSANDTSPSSPVLDLGQDTPSKKRRVLPAKKTDDGLIRHVRRHRRPHPTPAME